jgi:raffinose/stachyose/melibiose transport system permease protein
MNYVLGNKRAIAVFLAPALLVYVGVMIVPIVWSFVYAFFKGSPILGFEPNGLANFTKLFTDDVVRSATVFTIQYAIVITIGQIILGYLFALLYVFVLRRSSTVVRTLVFFPVVLPTVAVSLLFSRMFQVAPQVGPVNALLGLVGIAPVDWFDSGAHAFVVIVVMDLWRTMGFYAVLLYAGLIEIPEEVIESARLDGAAGWKLVRHIVLPMSMPVLLSSLIFSLNSAFKVFDSILA